MAKGAYQRGVVLNPDNVYRTPEEVASLIRENLCDSSKKYDFFEILVEQPFERKKKEEHSCIEVKGIMKLHSFTRTKDGRILGRELSCSDCIECAGVCEPCKENARVLYEPQEPELSLEEASPFHENSDEDDGGSEIEDQDAAGDDDAGSVLGGDTDLEGEDGVDGQEDQDLVDAIGPGAVVWCRRRQWYPAQVIDLHGVPQGIRKHLTEYPKDDYIVSLLPPFDEVCIVGRDRVRVLDENKVDKAYASRSNDVNRAYNYGLALKRGDV